MEHFFFGYTLFQRSIPPNTSPFPEVDIGVKALYCLGEAGDQVEEYFVRLQGSNLENAAMGRIVGAVRGQVIQLHPNNGGGRVDKLQPPKIDGLKASPSNSVPRWEKQKKDNYQGMADLT